MQCMHPWTRHMHWAMGRAAGVIVVGVLLLQYVPVGLLAQQWTDGGDMHHGCTEQVCHCGPRCTCSNCVHHGEAPPNRETGDPASGDGLTGDGLTLRSCGGGPAQGPTGAFVAAKSIAHPAPPGPAVPPRAEKTTLRLHESLVPQRLVDDIFHPPKERIG